MDTHKETVINSPDIPPSVKTNIIEETIEIVEKVDLVDSKPWTTSLLESLVPDTPTVAQMPVGKDSDRYNMRHPKRGKAIIFNHAKFSNGQSSRKGTEKDEHNLKVCLQTLGFEVIAHRDFQKHKIFEVLNTLQNEDHSDRDCLMIIVLSHGESDKIFSEDSEYRPEDIWNPFTSDRCPTLAGKPKIFLFQACRGDQLDGGTMLQAKARTQVDSLGFSSKKENPVEKNYVVPNRADFLLVFSTAPGYFSWRNTTDGSWFIQSVVKTLNKYKDKKDVLSMMTIVAREVALNFQSNVPNSPTFDMKKQVPMISSTLIREVNYRKIKKTYLANQKQKRRRRR